MVYIRIKQVKNIGYAYLVESKWNKEKHTSQQIIKQYLGPVSQININKIPKEYRSKSSIIKFLHIFNNLVSFAHSFFFKFPFISIPFPN